VLADELEIPLHMHVHETRDEIQQSLAQYGVRPLQRLADLQLTGSTLMAVHMTQLEAAEIESFAASGGHVVHCPESNLKLASGFCPAARLMAAGVNVALGTDGAASNNDLDLFSEMRTAALLAKGVAGDASALPAREALRMATINGARALGMDAEIGSLEPGKAADICAVDLSGLSSQPVYHPESQLVYATGRDSVSDLWIAGKQVLRSGQLTTLDQQRIVARASEWRDKIARFDH
jgi:5-methylthioadenosine/S-adenosylhomocysteine deaminase